MELLIETSFPPVHIYYPYPIGTTGISLIEFPISPTLVTMIVPDTPEAVHLASCISQISSAGLTFHSNYWTQTGLGNLNTDKDCHQKSDCNN
jgi:hypothetical protein